MEIAVLAEIPILSLMLGAGFLVVTHVPEFLQSGFFNRRQQYFNMITQRYMERIALAQGQIYQRSRQLERLSSQLSLSNQELAQLNEMKSKFLSDLTDLAMIEAGKLKMEYSEFDFPEMTRDILPGISIKRAKDGGSDQRRI